PFFGEGSPDKRDPGCDGDGARADRGRDPTSPEILSHVTSQAPPRPSRHHPRPMNRPARFGIGKRIAPARFLLCGVILIVATVAAGALGAEPRMALLIGFDFAAIVFLGAALPLLRSDAAAMRRTAQGNDANRVALLTITV